MREVECESLQEPITNSGLSEMLDDDDSSEKEAQAWTKSKNPHREMSPHEIHIIMPPPFIKENTYEDPMWPAPPPPSFGPYFEASQAYPSKRSSLARMFFIKTNLAKLEGVYNRDPWGVLYDTYYGRKPLFDELLRVATSSYRR